MRCSAALHPPFRESEASACAGCGAFAACVAGALPSAPIQGRRKAYWSRFPAVVCWVECGGTQAECQAKAAHLAQSSIADALCAPRPETKEGMMRAASRAMVAVTLMMLLRY